MNINTIGTFIICIILLFILGKIFAIFAIIIGVPLKDASVVGALMGTINIFFLIILSLIFSKLSLISLLYYFILMLSSITGGIFGINHKKR